MKLDVIALRALAAERELTLDQVLEAVEAALLQAYLKEVGEPRAARVVVNRKSGEAVVLVTDPPEPPASEDDDEHDDQALPAAPPAPVEREDTPPGFGRVAAMVARTAVRQRLREAADEATVGAYTDRTGQIVTGTVQQGGGRGVLVQLGDVEGIIPLGEQVPGERYVHGDVLRAFVLSSVKGPKGPQITLSRTHPKLVTGLFAREVPEVADGTVEVVAIAREAGHRSKIAVRSTRTGVNAKGACVGPAAARVRAVVDELRGEKIDIALWSEDPQVLLREALSPARVTAVEVVDAETKTARVVVPDYQLSLAIGREGQNARLAARLTGWRIDIRSDTGTTDQPVRAGGVEAGAPRSSQVAPSTTGARG